jgi:hypothetical protein
MKTLPATLGVAVVLLLAALAALLQPGPAFARAPKARRPPASVSAGVERSLAVYPPQRIPLAFDHQHHVSGMGMSCRTCHEAASSSTRAADRLLPRPTVCDDCHDADHTDENAVTGAPEGCHLCHVGHVAADGNKVARVVLPPPNLNFNHRAHVGRSIDCRQCHDSVHGKDMATREDLPPMERCLECHGLSVASSGDARGDCLVCHLSNDGRHMVTRFDTGSMLPPRWLQGADHGPGWIERHSVVAAADSTFCSSCHEESECVECHDGRVRPRRVHPNDWLSLHSTAARQGSPTCTDCHRQQTFCLGCHQRAGVTLRGPTAVAASRGRFHPPRSTWTDPPRSPGHHSWEAQRNLDACVSCHSERDCATCHATRAAGATMPMGAGRVSPHPPGFRDQCRGPFDRNARPCLVCHLPGDPQLSRCR